MLVLLSTDSWVWFVYAWEVLGVLSFFLVKDRLACGALLWSGMSGGALMLLPCVEHQALRDLLLLFAILTKSSQWPFDRWIGQVSVAPNHISAFLHGATLIQSGLILLLRLAPSGWVLCAGLVISGLMTGVTCVGDDAGKRLVVAATQVFISCNILGYGLGLLDAHEVWEAIQLHALYKPPLFFLSNLSVLGLGSTVACIACGLAHCSSSIVWMPCMVLYWKLLRQLFATGCVGWSVPVVIWYLILCVCWQPKAVILLAGAALCCLLSKYRRSLRLMGALLMIREGMGCVVSNCCALLLSYIQRTTERHDMIGAMDGLVRLVGDWCLSMTRELEVRAVLLSAILMLLEVQNLSLFWMLLRACAVLFVCAASLARLDRAERIALYCLLSACTTTCMGLHGAFDVMITQITVDSLGLLYLVRSMTSIERVDSTRWIDLLLSVLFASLLYLRLSVSQELPLAVPGDTINTIVSDKRGLDTLGEVCVFALAGCCVDRYLCIVRPHQKNTSMGLLHDLDRIWGLRWFQICGLTFATLFLLREWLVMIVTKYRAEEFIKILEHGHSGGFASGVICGLVCASGWWRMPYDLVISLGILLIAVLGATTQWTYLETIRPWLFECGIGCVVAGVVYVLIGGLYAKFRNPFNKNVQ
jgi:multisubunit Na+/H+ antiporter MnhB subunit